MHFFPFFYETLEAIRLLISLYLKTLLLSMKLIRVIRDLWINWIHILQWRLQHIQNSHVILI